MTEQAAGPNTIVTRCNQPHTNLIEDSQKKEIIIANLEKKVTALSKENAEVRNNTVNHFLKQQG